MNKLQIEYLPITVLASYPGNAKIHTAEQIEQIKKSIKEFGMNDPIAVWKNNEIIEGHGRLIACTELGIDKVPVIRLDELTDEQRRAYMLVHNKLTMDTGFDIDVLSEELESLKDFDIDMKSFGFTDSEVDIEIPDFEEEGIYKEKTETYNLIVFCGSEEERQKCKKFLNSCGYDYKEE